MENLKKIFYSEYIRKYGKKNIEGKDNSFTQLIDKCKEGGKVFGDYLLDYESTDDGVLFCYLNIAMTSTATVKFKERMAYEKFSEAITIFEEAFAILLLENNFARWVYFAEKKRKEQNNSLEGDNNNDNEDNDSNEGQSSSSSTLDDSDKTVENIPDVLYQQKIKKRKDKRETAGKWTPEGMKRLNSLITMVQDSRNSDMREEFEEDLQDIYIKHADSNMELMAKSKRKREIEEMNSRKKGIVVKNILDLVAL